MVFTLKKFGFKASSFFHSVYDHPYYPFAGVTFLIGVLVFYIFFVSAPSNFPVSSLVSVDEGATLKEVARNFYSAGVIRSPSVFRILVEFFGGEGGVLAGDYFFSKPRNVFGIADKVSKGEFGLLPVSVRVPEGATRFEIAKILDRKFGRLSPEKFLDLTKGKEGYLFPDTYFFLPNVKAGEVARVMEDNFYARILEIKDKITKFGKNLDDVVTMASILEKEASDLKTMRMISGILWKRLQIDMPLQVDAAFLYINGKNTYNLTLDDLATSSPYNTYKHKGLPPGAIANPGLNALLAAVTPIKTDFLFYLSDKEGNTYYSSTFEGHKINKRLYVY